MSNVARSATARPVGVTVRGAEPRDVVALSVLCAEHAAFERVAFEPDGQVTRLQAALFAGPTTAFAWVAERQHEIVGYATASAEFSTWRAAWLLHMDCLYVRAACRGAGIGAALLEAVIAHARSRDLLEVQWQTPAWNAGAQRFYQRRGARAAGKVRFTLPLTGAGGARCV